MKRVAVLALCATLATAAQAVNKCTHADGSVSYQDAPCDRSTSATTVKTWDSPPPPRYSGTPTSARRRVDPNSQLVGPPQAAALIGIYRRWIDAEKLALSAPRVALAGPIATMQALARDAESVQVPSCMAEAKAALGSITSKSATALLSFLGDKNDLMGMVYQLLDRDKLVTDFERGVTTARCDG